MVEIISRGKSYADRTFECRCPECASHLRFKGSEVETPKSAWGVRIIRCPVCGFGISVDVAAQEVLEDDIGAG